MRYRIIRNWIDTAELMMRKSFILVPFLIWGFIEAVVLDLIFFFPGVPLGKLVNPIVAKLYGEQYIHYPGNLTILPKLFSKMELLIFIAIGAFLSMITIDLVVRTTRGVELKGKDVLENYLRRYLPCVAYAILIAVIGLLVRRFHPILFDKTLNPLLRHLPSELAGIRPFAFLISMLVVRLAINTFFICVLPFIVIQKRHLIPAVLQSLRYGVTNFLPLFITMLVPYLLYMPVIVVKSYQSKLVSMTSPDMVFYINLAGIFILKIVECFVIACIARFVMEKVGLIKEPVEIKEEEA